MKNIIFPAVVLFCCFSMNNATAQQYVILNDGMLPLDQIRVGNAYFSATLRMEQHAGMFPTFVVDNVDQVNPDGTNSSTYDPQNRTLQIPNVWIGSSGYSITLKAMGDSLSHFRILNMSPTDHVSFLFMITAENATFSSGATYGNTSVGDHFIIDADSPIVVFSDRPYRIANSFGGGLTKFADFYAGSDFHNDPPNVTFAGQNMSTDQFETTVFEMTEPFVFGDQFIVPVAAVIGNETQVSAGEYANISFIVDDWLDDLEDADDIVLTTADCAAEDVAIPELGGALCDVEVADTINGISNQ